MGVQGQILTIPFAQSHNIFCTYLPQFFSYFLKSRFLELVFIHSIIVGVAQAHRVLVSFLQRNFMILLDLQNFSD